MIRILTDSSTGLTLEDCKKHQIEMVHMPITFDDGEFLDAKNITNAQFYEKLAASKNLPKTSLITQPIFEEIFEDVKKNKDELIVMCISQHLSATYEASIKAKQAVGYNKIYICDTLSTVNSLIALVMEAVKMRDDGKNGEEINECLKELVKRVRLYAYVDTLRYLRAGGRISTAKAIVGTILGIKPSLSIEGGKLFSHHKYMGIKKAQDAVISEMKNFDSKKPVYFAHANAVNEGEEMREKALKAYPAFRDGGLYNISATVGTHTGPGTITVVGFEK